VRLRQPHDRHAAERLWTTFRNRQPVRHVTVKWCTFGPLLTSEPNAMFHMSILCRHPRFVSKSIPIWPRISV
jgi:hypothetical protein